MEFKDLKKGDTFEATFEVDGEETRSGCVRVKGKDGSHWIPSQSFQNLKILPRPISVGDSVSYGKLNGSIATVLHIHEEVAFLVVDRSPDTNLYFTQSLKSLTRISK